jgi:hypothetical protein
LVGAFGIENNCILLTKTKYSMFNSPLLDTAIGLVFIILLYSLLATSLIEALATLFAFRASMLRKAIVQHMLSNTNFKANAYENVLKKLHEKWAFIIRVFNGKPYNYGNSLGGNFYKHPIIKSYGTGNRFSIPSYISKENFATVLVDVLNNLFESFKEEIIKQNPTIADVNSLTSIEKIMLLLAYFKGLDDAALDALQQNGRLIIEKETLKILLLHINKGYNKITDFTKSIENWYDDNMNRVSGWYKRRTQFILFVIGLFIAIMFNVDVLQIASKLSTDKDARDKIVQMAIASSEKYKDDPRIKRLETIIAKDTVQRKDSIQKLDSAAAAKQYDSLIAAYAMQKEAIKKVLETDIAYANNLLAIGWGDYGLAAFEQKVKANEKLKAEFNGLYANNLKVIAIEKIADSTRNKKQDSSIANLQAISEMYAKSTCVISPKLMYIISNACTPRKMLGFLLLAFSICLGSPFWFDLMQKLIKLRASGTKPQ